MCFCSVSVWLVVLSGLFFAVEEFIEDLREFIEGLRTLLCDCTAASLRTARNFWSVNGFATGFGLASFSLITPDCLVPCL